MELKTISLGQRPARVWTGGTGEAIVLLHGSWAGAQAYWSTVTDDLERTHLVVERPHLRGCNRHRLGDGLDAELIVGKKLRLGELGLAQPRPGGARREEGNDTDTNEGSPHRLPPDRWSKSSLLAPTLSGDD